MPAYWSQLALLAALAIHAGQAVEPLHLATQALLVFNLFGHPTLNPVHWSLPVEWWFYFTLPVSPTSTLIFAALMGLTWLGVIPLLNGIVVEIFGIRFLSTLTGIAFFSHQVGSFLGAWGGGAIFDALGSYDRALQFGVIVGLIAGLAQILMDDRPTARVAAAGIPVPEPGR